MRYRRAMFDWLFGLVAGFMLSAMRAPLGMDLLQIPAVDADAAYRCRAAAMFTLAVAWWWRRDGEVSIRFLLATLLGFAVHSLFLANGWVPSSPLELTILAVVALLLLVQLGRARRGESVEPAVTSPSFLQMLGSCAAGAGVAVAFESIARHVRLFGASLAQDDSMTAIVLLAGVAIGAAALGWLARSGRLRDLAFPTGLAAAATSCFVSLQIIGAIDSTRGLDRFLRWYGLDSSLHGTLLYDALVAASCFVLPAFVLGAALRGARSRLTLSSALLGAALALFLFPRLLEPPKDSSVADIELFSAQLVPLGTLIAVAGAALALLATHSRTALARWAGLAFTLLLCLAPLAIPVMPKLVISPWMVVPPRQHLVFDGPGGLATVEPSSSGLQVATLDRRELTPSADDVGADERRIRASVAMVPRERRGKVGPTVLLIGQWSPLRALAFTSAGVTRVDRSAAWFDGMRRLDEKLFESLPASSGERLDTREARRRIDAGEYDLVIVLPVSGDPPELRDLGVPVRTTLVAWFAFGERIVARDVGAQVIFSTDGIDDPCIGMVVHGATLAADDRDAPLLVSAGEAISSPVPLTWLMKLGAGRFDERESWCRAHTARRLSDAARGGPNEKLMRAFAILYSRTVRGAESDAREDKIELPDEALALFEEVALAGPPGAFVRQMWEGLARLLLAKREIGDIFKYVKPLAEKYAPWPALEEVLAQGDLEALEPESAVRRYRALIDARALAPTPMIASDTADAYGAASSDAARARDTALGRSKDLELWYWLGESQRRAGDHTSAAQSWQRALELAPDNRNLKRALAMELVRAADPEGRKMVEELLQQTPDDAELLLYLQPGPYPEPGSRYVPRSGGGTKHRPGG